MKGFVSNWVRHWLRKILRWSAQVFVVEQEHYQLARLRECLGVGTKEFFAQWPVTVSGNVRVGNRVSMAAYVHIWGEGGVFIGDEVMIGSHTAIVSNTHDPHVDRMWNVQVLAPVRIEDNVWIGCHCIILPGVTIGTGSIIGAGSVVTRDVPPYHIAYGVPARAKPREVKQIS